MSELKQLLEKSVFGPGLTFEERERALLLILRSKRTPDFFIFFNLPAIQDIRLLDEYSLCTIINGVNENGI